MKALIIFLMLAGVAWGEEADILHLLNMQSTINKDFVKVNEAQNKQILHLLEKVRTLEKKVNILCEPYRVLDVSPSITIRPCEGERLIRHR